MPRLIELIRQSAVPPGVIRSAAKGSLSLPPSEMVEVLVYLAEHSQNVKEDAQNTLAGWSDEALTPVLADPDVSREVLMYFLAAQNLRLSLLEVIIENSSVPDDSLILMATTGSREVVEALINNKRVRGAVPVLRALVNNPSLTADEATRINADLLRMGAPAPVIQDEGSHVNDREVNQWITEHVNEIKAEEGKAFSLVGGIDGNVDSDTAEATQITQEALAKAQGNEEELERLSTLQKLARLTVGERVQAAMKGNREERSILIRDGAKIVSSAVLASPKLTEAEVETFASMKNVQENVLRDIGRNRKFIKNYVVLKNLTTNPRTPLDLSLTLVKNMLAPDLKGLSQNKNVPDTLRKMALKLFKMRSSPSGKAE
jgi:hypothetical protein